MTTMVMDTTQLRADAITRHVVGQVVNAIAARDWVALALTVSPEMVYWRPGTADRVDGADAYVAQWRAFVEGASELAYRPHTVLVQGDTAMIEASADGVDTSGTAFSYSLVTVMRVAGGKLVEEREYIVPRTRS